MLDSSQLWKTVFESFWSPVNLDQTQLNLSLENIEGKSASDSVGSLRNFDEVVEIDISSRVAGVALRKI